MAKSAVITIYQKKQDSDDLKRMIRGLSKCDVDGNPYRGRSESEVAKMLLRDLVKKEYKKFCGLPKTA